MDSHKWIRGCVAGSLLWCALLAIPAICPATSLAAQQQASRQEQEVLKLRDDVEQLKAQQQQILDGLNDLKSVNSRALAGQGGAVPAITLPKTVNLAGESFRGTASAPVVIVEYGDFECRFCRRFAHLTYPQLRDTYINTGQARYYFRDMPLEMHPLAVPAARAAHCAAEQGQYWPMHDTLFADGLFLVSDIDKSAAKLGLDVAKLDGCTASERVSELIKHDTEEARNLGIRGTPTFLIGTAAPGEDNVTFTQSIVGAEDFDSFKAIMEPLLAATTPAAAVARHNMDAKKNTAP